MTRLALFDLDGTILDTLSDLASAVNWALSSENQPRRSTEEIRSFLGNGIRSLVHLSLSENASEDTEKKVFDSFVNYYGEHCADKTTPYDDIPELFAELRNRGIKIAVVSNKADFAAQKLCKKFFSGAYDFALGAKDGVAKKPARDMIDECLSAFPEISSEECVYIGYSEVDVETAKNAGMRGIAVQWGFRSTDELKKAGATVFAATPKELFQKIIGEN